MRALTVTVDSCHSRIRLRKDSPGERARLTRLHRDALGEPLIRALEASGVREEQPVCVRRLEVSLRVRRGATDAAIVLGLAELVALALTEARARGDVIEYGSRAHAVADLALRAAAGDVSRAWAWSQLGLWEESAAESAAAVLLALLDEPASIVPVLARLATRPPLLRALAPRIGRAGWRALVRAALRVSGAPPDAAELPAESSRARGAGIVTVLPRPSAAERTRVHAALARSPLPAALAGASPPDAAQVAALALLDADPVLVASAARASVLVRYGAERLGAHLPEPAAVERTPLVGSAAAREARGDAADPALAKDPVGSVRVSPPSPAPSSAGSPAKDDVPRAPTAELAADPAPDAAVPVRSGEVDDGRARGTTAHAGLLFLLHLVPEVVLPRVRSDGPLAARALRWTLHQLALRLAPELQPGDAAALAFAGLAPDAPAPDADAPAATAEESAALGALARACGAGLARRLGRPARAARDLVGETLRRRALVVADPGWIEVRLALDEVSTAVRAAGLDCDPGWLPWLGVVVRFVYE